MSEAALWKWLARARQSVPGTLLQRVENSAGKGQPDVFGICERVPLFIELKCCEVPKRPSTPLRIIVRPSQIEWHTDWHEAGGRSFFLIQAGSQRCLVPWWAWKGRMITLDELRRIKITTDQCTPSEVVLAAARA